MSDSIDIHNLLQTGYFTTSRYKNQDRLAADLGASNLSRSAPSDPGYFLSSSQSSVEPEAEVEEPAPEPEPRRTRQRVKPPPSPRVDDEDTILSQEHGSTKLVVSAEEPTSRGDIDQDAVIMDVHEFNPERRFVMINDDSPTTAATGNTPKKPELSEPSETSKSYTKRDSKSQTASDTRSREPSEEPRRRPTTPPRSQDDSRRKQDDSRRSQGDSRLDPRPRVERRRSRQDLPVIDTAIEEMRQPEHHRSKSAASASRPDYFYPQRTSRYGEQLLSPEIIKHGANGREYHSSSNRDSSSRLGSNMDSRGHSNDRSVSSSRRNGASDDRDPIRRPSSNDRAAPDYRYKDQQTTSRSRYEDGGSSRQYSRDPSTRSDNSSAYTSRERERERERESNRTREEYAKSSRRGESKTPVVSQEERKSDRLRTERDDVRRERSPMRRQTLPVQPVASDPAGKSMQPTLRPASTFIVTDESHSTSNSLPYPDEDPMMFPYLPPPNGKGPASQRQEAVDIPPMITMPEIPPDAPSYVVASYQADRVSDEGGDSSVTKRASWQPMPFDPEKDGVHLERPVGTYRRYSENRNEGGEPSELPECPRMKPVAGKMDWLTLPRSNFNICPDCYGSVFASTQYRTQFQPFFHPTTEPIVCDFGSSPWYRIAWLLVQKNQEPTLDLFLKLANVMHPERNSPCPEHKKTTRRWLTVREPSTGRPVPEFTVCYRCAETVETLLPNLDRTFVPFDDRSGSFKSICALHFTPERRDFVLFFDAFETTAERAAAKATEPNVSELAKSLTKLTIRNKCREDNPVTDGYWYYAQFLPEFTVCTDCYNAVVKPRLDDDSVVTKNFCSRPQKLTVATCQLYSSRMRDIFKKACRADEPEYLKEKVRQRMRVEADIHAKLVKLDRQGHDGEWVDDQVDKLIREWRKWE